MHVHSSAYFSIIAKEFEKREEVMFSLPFLLPLLKLPIIAMCPTVVRRRELGKWKIAQYVRQ